MGSELQSSPLPGRRITDLVELDAKLTEIAASPRGPAAHFNEFWFDMQMPEGLDPLSPAYRAAVLAQYCGLAQRDYSTEFEAHPFDVATDHDFFGRPFPYNTGDAGQVGSTLMAVGFVISTCRPRRGHRILEMRASWGNLALPLAQMGCAVTAVDIEDRYLRIIRHRAERMDVKVRTVQARFLDAAEKLGDERFDFVLFHAAFHHCDDHLVMLRLIRDKLLALGGRLVLAGEPLLEALPYPWGLNPMGEGIWAIRKFGWHELVFRPSYLLHALSVMGYHAAFTACPLTPLGNVILAYRQSGPSLAGGPISGSLKEEGLEPSSDGNGMLSRESADIEVLRQEVNSQRWLHQIDFGGGIISPGLASLEYLKVQANIYFAGGVVGKSVLDIGCWDGFNSIEAARRGARRVLATDHWVWAHHPWASRKTIELARRHLAPAVEVMDIDVKELTPERVGQFDIVLFCGVLYHLRHPLLVLEGVARLVGELLVVETAMDAANESRPAMIFFPGDELNGDRSNWWGPNRACVEALLRDVGFSEVTFTPHPLGPGRGIFHARRSASLGQSITGKE